MHTRKSTTYVWAGVTEVNIWWPVKLRMAVRIRTTETARWRGKYLRANETIVHVQTNTYTHTVTMNENGPRWQICTLVIVLRFNFLVCTRVCVCVCVYGAIRHIFAMVRQRMRHYVVKQNHSTEHTHTHTHTPAIGFECDALLAVTVVVRDCRCRINW